MTRKSNHFPLPIFVFILIIISMARVLNGQNLDNDHQPAEEPSSELDQFSILHTLEALCHWANKDETLHAILSERLAHLKKEAELIKKYRGDYEGTSGLELRNLRPSPENSNERGKVIGASVVLSHILTSRYVKLVGGIRGMLKDKISRDIKGNICDILTIPKDHQNAEAFNLDQLFRDLGHPEPHRFPNHNDLYSSFQAILHIQEILGLSPEQIFNGLTFDTHFGGTLTAAHCAKLGIFALEQEYYFMAIEWLELAKSLLGNGNDNLISLGIVNKLLQVAIDAHNHHLIHPVDENDPQMYFYANPINSDEPKESRMTMQSLHYQQYSSHTGNDSFRFASFLGLCGGHDFQPIQVKSRLKCYLERKLHPYFILNPVKTEQLSEYPLILHMYDVLGNDAIEKLHRVRGSPQLSSVVTVSDVKATLKQRSSAGFLVEDSQVREKVTKLTEMLTGLRIDRKHEEELQIMEYIYGGYYTHHM